ncbi:MAG: hypothetical protein ACE5FW_01300 [Candidatus Aenigmatarchaeota archaeon]
MPKESERVTYAVSEEALRKVYSTDPDKRLDKLPARWGPDEFAEYIKYDGCFSC